MATLDLLPVATFSLLSSSSKNTSSASSIIPQTLNSFVKKKLYRRTIRRTSANTSSFRRSSSSISPPSYRNQRHKWKIVRRKSNAKSPLRGFFGRQDSRESSVNKNKTPSPRRCTAHQSIRDDSVTPRQISSIERSLGDTPRTGQSIITIDDEDENEASLTPSPIRNSPCYGRKSRRRDAEPSVMTTAWSSPCSYPELPIAPETPATVTTQTASTSPTIPTAIFRRYHVNAKLESRIDADLIDRLRKGLTGENRNQVRGRVYTAAIEGEFGYVKIGWTAQKLEERIAQLKSPISGRKVYNMDDSSLGAQSRFLNGYFAEQMIQIELSNLRRVAINSGCTEWFEIDIEQAQRVCGKWRNWLRQYKPFGEDQKLTEFWRRRLDEMADIDPYDSTKHGCLHERWMKFLNPDRDSSSDRISHIVSTACKRLRTLWTWMRENRALIIGLLGAVIWALCGVFILLIYILSVAINYPSLTTPAKEQDKRKDSFVRRKE